MTIGDLGYHGTEFCPHCGCDVRSIGSRRNLRAHLATCRTATPAEREHRIVTGRWLRRKTVPLTRRRRRYAQ